MSADDSSVSASSLTETLQLAFAQCQEQVRALARQSETVDQLRQENERLKHELVTIRTSSTEDLEKKYQAQFQNLFQQNASKQAEIDQLKDKLQNVREKARRRGLVDPISSSPALPLGAAGNQSAQQPLGLVSPSARPETRISMNKTADRSQTPDPGSRHLARNSKKRIRSLSPPVRLPLKEISVNIDHTVPNKRANDFKVKRPRLSDRGAAAIPFLTEDGEDHSHIQGKRNVEQKSKPIRESIYQRLDNLLENQDLANPSILNTKIGSFDNAKTDKMGAASAKANAPPFGLLTPSTASKPRKSRTSIGVSRKLASPGPEDEEPFRARPLHRQTLAHFKLNPATNSGLDYAYNQVTRGQSRSLHPGCTKDCCRHVFTALASTSTLPSHVSHLSDDDLLLRFLGAGSEDRIRNLTVKARENLLHEARIKVMADTYGKMHRDAHERGKSPPGFWTTDWPGSQEERDNRETAKRMEREEIERRYHDALKGGGRWIFADE